MSTRRGNCTAPGCEAPHNARGWCRKHYSRWKRRGSDPTTPPPAAQLGAPCWVEECDRVVTPKSAKGLCPTHYQRMLATGSPTGSAAPPPVDRFFEKVQPRGECWEWTASRDAAGYGLFSAKREGVRGHIVRAHIWAFEYFIAPVPAGLQLDHLCHDTFCRLGTDCPHRRCANPWHLEPVPPAVNTERGCGQRRENCPVGHRYDLPNTYINPRGTQVCRKCMAVHRARYESKKRAA